MKQFVLAGFAVALAAILIAGCGMFDSNENPVDEGDNLAAYGGYTTANEAPGFGDPGLMARHPEDDPYDDEVSNYPEVSNARRGGGAKIYMLRMIWGNIDNPDTNEDVGDCPITDWSGSIKADGGVLIIRRLIRFEPDDYIVRPRRGAHQAAWVSHTHNHVDGILFEIIDVPDPRHKEVANSLTITTPLYSAVIPFDSLGELNQILTYDDCNKISLVGTEIKLIRCPRGFLEGTWVSETDTSGNFEGAWIRDDGNLSGYIHGRYGVRDEERVLVGKWITTSGQFGGLLKGTWGPMIDENEDDEDGPDGYFEGTWVNDALTAVGRFKGHYCFPDTSANGVFRGRWDKDCR